MHALAPYFFSVDYLTERYKIMLYNKNETTNYISTNGILFNVEHDVVKHGNCISFVNHKHEISLLIGHVEIVNFKINIPSVPFAVRYNNAHMRAG